MAIRIRTSLNKRAGEIQGLSVRLRVSFDNNRVDLSTGYTIDLTQWDGKKEQVKHGISNAQGYTYSEINQELEARKAFVSDYFTRCSLEKVSPSQRALKEAYKQKFNRSRSIQPQGQTLFDYFDEFIRVEGSDKSWKSATIKKFTTLKNHLLTFNSNLEFSNLSENGLRDFADYQFTSLSNSSAEKNHKLLKWFLGWATSKGYNKERAFETFKVTYKIANNAPIFLTWAELMTLHDLEVPATKNYLKRIQDLFCFSSFTSLRYSDLMNLKWSNVKQDHIELIAIKDRDLLKIDLNTYSRAILNRCKNIPVKGDSVFQYISNQKYNEYLKELGELCQLNEQITRIIYKKAERIEITLPKYKFLTTHCARRTFISYAISQGIPPNVVMKWTGHSDYKAMRPYIAIADQTKKEAMTKLFDKEENCL